MNISVIGVHTPAQVDALQASTGMDMRIGRNGAYLAPKDHYAALVEQAESSGMADPDEAVWPEFAA
jgi:hypothetical protein